MNKRKKKRGKGGTQAALLQKCGMCAGSGHQCVEAFGILSGI